MINDRVKIIKKFLYKQILYVILIDFRLNKKKILIY